MKKNTRSIDKEEDDEMREYLPGNLQERLRELREAKGYTGSRVADEIGIDRTTYGRIENGSTKTISSDILLKLAVLYEVPTDYILGISDTPENTAYDIKELGLSVEAAKNLYSGKVDPRVVNELLISDKFAMATRMMAMYFSSSVARMMTAHNELLSFTYGLLDDMVIGGKIPGDIDIREAKQKLKASKIPAEGVELSRVQMQLMSAVREVKKKVVEEVSSLEKRPECLNAEIIKRVKEEVLATPGLKDMPENEKAQVIKFAILKGIELDQDIDEEKMETIEPEVERFVLFVKELWKEDLKK